jgi:hypothetical protein
MSYKQLNRDFSSTYVAVVSRYNHTLGSSYRRDIESCIRDAERYFFELKEDSDPMHYAEVQAVVSHSRYAAAYRSGVYILPSPIPCGARRRAAYRVPILRFLKDESLGWVWRCPLRLRHSEDLHWKGLIERDKWLRFIKRLNSVCAEASIFAHAFRHGA